MLKEPYRKCNTLPSSFNKQQRYIFYIIIYISFILGATIDIETKDSFTMDEVYAEQLTSNIFTGIEQSLLDSINMRISDGLKLCDYERGCGDSETEIFRATPVLKKHFLDTNVPRYFQLREIETSSRQIAYKYNKVFSDKIKRINEYMNMNNSILLQEYSRETDIETRSEMPLYRMGNTINKHEATKHVCTDIRCFCLYNNCNREYNINVILKKMTWNISDIYTKHNQYYDGLCNLTDIQHILIALRESHNFLRDRILEKLKILADNYYTYIRPLCYIQIASKNTTEIQKYEKQLFEWKFTKQKEFCDALVQISQYIGRHNQHEMEYIQMYKTLLPFDITDISNYDKTKIEQIINNISHNEAQNRKKEKNVYTFFKRAENKILDYIEKQQNDMKPLLIPNHEPKSLTYTLLKILANIFSTNQQIYSWIARIIYINEEMKVGLDKYIEGTRSHNHDVFISLFTKKNIKALRNYITGYINTRILHKNDKTEFFIFSSSDREIMTKNMEEFLNFLQTRLNEIIEGVFVKTVASKSRKNRGRK